MCGIVAAIGRADVTSLLLSGLQRLEYRGYDSAGVAVINQQGQLVRQRTVGKVQVLAEQLQNHPLPAELGIAHTRWATHGVPSERNAHPHFSAYDVAIVHNGIIENHDILRAELIAQGYIFTSETDTEVVAHTLGHEIKQTANFLEAVEKTLARLRGVFSLAIISPSFPEQLIGVCQGAPLVIGITNAGMLLASDQLALLAFTKQFIHLQPGDTAVLTDKNFKIYQHGQTIERPLFITSLNDEQTQRHQYPHFMLKEIYEQPKAIADTISSWANRPNDLIKQFGTKAEALFNTTQRILIVACGTSYHSGLVARYWLEALAGIPCEVEIASEFRYRQPVIEPHTLFIAISQSGETADTLAALRLVKQQNIHGTLTICNVAESTLARTSDCVFLTQAGPEIGVASTKAFTAQLTALLLLTGWFAQHQQKNTGWMQALKQLPDLLDQTLALDSIIKLLAVRFTNREHALFLGRGSQYPIALEGALKLKELAYIQCEAYPAGELKHGPLALVDNQLPIIMLAPNNYLLEKLQANLHEVRARGGQVIVFTNAMTKFITAPELTFIELPNTPDILAPIVYSLPLQLLAYHVAVLRGNDVDKPRNLAKSVTVE